MFKFASSFGFACVLGLGILIATANAAKEDHYDEDVQAIGLVRVHLFPAGQGVFEFDVPIDGEHELRLWLTETERDDLLKTLVSSQLDTIRVTYPTEDTKDIPAFAQLARDPSTTLAEFLQGLRGQSISLRRQGETLQGTLVGVESSTQTIGQVTQSIEWVCLHTADGLVRTPLDPQSVVSLTSPELQSRLERILQRKQGAAVDRLPVTLHVKKKLSQHGRFAFALETAPWKCAYRIVSNENQHDLQASAIIDNTSGLDWNDVEVILVVDQLLGFHAPLSQIADWGRDSMTIPAPFSATPPMLAAGVRRRVGSAFVENVKPQHGFGMGGGGMGGGGIGGMGGFMGDGMGDAAGSGGEGRTSAWRHNLQNDQRLGITFSAEDLQHSNYGRRVHVSLPKVTLAAGKSTTLFLPNLPQLVEEVRVYAKHIHEKHPLSAFQLTLQENYQLPGGPGAVWKSNGYSGDVMIPRLVSGVPQLVTYAVDGLIEIRHEQPNLVSYTSLPSNWRSDGEALIETVHRQRIHRYRIQNDGEKSALLFIEHQASNDEWFPVPNDALIETQKADEYRYRIRVAASRSDNLEVAEQMSEKIEWSSKTQLADLKLKLKEPALDPVVKQVMEQWITSIDQKSDYVTQSEKIKRQLHQTTQEQNRIKELLSAVIRGDELYKRYIDKLNTLENEIDTAQESLRTLQSNYDATREAGEKTLSSCFNKL